MNMRVRENLKTRARISFFFVEYMACNFPFVLVRDVPVFHVVPVPCGKCESCRKDKVQMWSDRMSFEALTSFKPSTFLTLTYDDAHLPRDRSVHLEDMQHFHKRLRYYLQKRSPNYDLEKVRFFGSSEYGDQTYRPHYHFAITNIDCFDKKDFSCLYDAWRDKETKEPIGIMTADSLNPARIRYTIEYINYETPAQSKAYEALGLKPLIHTMSKGIGKDWIYAHADEIKRQEGYYVNGQLRPIPRYWKEKLGMIELNAYVKDLPRIWQPYNDLLIERGEKPIDPFNLDDIYDRHLFDQKSPESKRTVLSWLIGNDVKERALVHRRLLKEAKPKICL